jgi:RHS repeat-associated protein
VKKANSTETVYYVYDDAGHMIGEYDAAGTLIQELIWLGDTPVALRGKMPCLTGGTCTETANAYIWTDHLNTPREITRVNASNAHVSTWKWDSLPFGETLPNANPTNLGVMTFNHRFPGQYRDKETGLHQNWNRDYEPKVGRYVESDPIGLSGGANTFSYCSANPVGKEDRNGLFELTICEVRFLESNYGETGAAIVAGFNLQSLASLPTETVDLVRTLLTLGGAGLLKAILPEYLELLGKEICPVLADFGRNASAAASAQRLAGTISSAGSLLGRGLGVLA